MALLSAFALQYISMETKDYFQLGGPEAGHFRGLAFFSACVKRVLDILPKYLPT